LDIDNKLEKIFEFLNSNREHNHNLQERFYGSVLKPFNNIPEKIISLLYHIANTQSQPKIDNLAKFFIELHENIECVNSFQSFIEYIKPKSETEINFRTLYLGMEKQSGWGKKTSALFVKTIFHLHNSEYSKDLKIWNDVPKTIEKSDEFFLPVDAVIISIFSKLNSEMKWDFDKVNTKLKAIYKEKEIEIWDDLWFWGFITQNGTGENRKFEWNVNKYWALKETDKRKTEIKIIEQKAESFLKLMK
jgi:hypothetical protein